METITGPRPRVAYAMRTPSRVVTYSTRTVTPAWYEVGRPVAKRVGAAGAGTTRARLLPDARLHRDCRVRPPSGVGVPVAT